MEGATPGTPVAVLVAGILPLGWLAWRAGWLDSPLARRAAAGVALVALAASLPWQGVDFLYLKRFDLFVCAATIAVVLARDRLERRTRLVSLGGLAVFSLVVYSNFFSFHGEHTFVHLHDVAHYYLGSKYFAELGYGSLYTAMLRAEAEDTGNRFKAIEARDLASGEVVHIRSLLMRSEAVRRRFSPERWADFRKDAAWFRTAMGRQYGELLVDHGFNPTPLWALGGGFLANRVPAGSHAGLVVLCLLDPLILGAVAALVASTFGVETALLAIIHYTVLFGASFGWVGGAFLRHVWLASLLAAACSVERGRHGLAGALLAVAAVLRVFPAFFVAGFGFRAASGLARAGRIEERDVRLLGAFAVTAAALVAATVAGYGGLDPWREFLRNLGTHMQNYAVNLVGLTPILAHPFEAARPGMGSVEHVELRRFVYHLQLAGPFLLAVFLAVRRRRRAGDLEAMTLAIPLLFTGLNLASYYYSFLILLLLLHGREATRVAMIFAAELGVYVLLLFEESEGRLFLYRSLLLLYLFVALAAGRRGGERAEAEGDPGARRAVGQGT